MPLKSVNDFFNHRFDNWLKRRVPSSGQHKLSRKNIFILPSKFGFSYLLFVFLLFLLATNYQNNIIMLMSYLLASLFITVMMHSFYNLSGLELTSKSKYSGFAKQPVTIAVTIVASKQHFDLTLSFAKQPQQQQVYLAQCQQGNTAVALCFVATARGVVDIGRIKIASEYSFGLFTSWAVLDFAHQATIYPQPKKIDANQYLNTGQETHHDSTQQVNPSAGLDDFSELKPYVLGESKSRIAWKQFARGQGRYTKHYQAQQGSIHWLNLRDMPSSHLESQLSYLCYLVLEYSQHEQCFGLDLSPYGGNTTKSADYVIAPEIGLLHQTACLTALAKFHQYSGSV